MYYYHLTDNCIDRKIFQQIDGNNITNQYCFSVINPSFKDELEEFGINDYKFFKYMDTTEYFIELFLLDKFPEINPRWTISGNDCYHDTRLHYIRTIQTEFIVIGLSNKSDAAKFVFSNYCYKKFTYSSKILIIPHDNTGLIKQKIK